MMMMVVVTAKHIVEGGLDASGRCILAVSVFTTLQILYNTIIPTACNVATRFTTVL